MATSPTLFPPNSSLDLVFERVIDVPKAILWKAWTEPEQLKKWFTPVPWKTVECEIALRPGGLFYTVMRSPEGEDNENFGCYLEVIENERLIWTNALTEGYRPILLSSEEDFFLTVIVTFSDHSQGTLYRAQVIHANEGDRDKHNAMGFQEGWGQACDQLVALAKAL
jgi:uncharacterized protein YndB with AHSA1/START domain